MPEGMGFGESVRNLATDSRFKTVDAWVDDLS